ncbi:MAG: Holliday junction resolvase RuvX [Planctomycetota bacterium]
MRSLGIDLGGKRTGLALSDPAGQFVSPLRVIESADRETVIAGIVEACADEGVEQIVTGCPLNMDGTAGKPALEALRFARIVRDRTGLPTFLFDERRTSLAADAQLAQRRAAGEKLTHKKKKQRRDALAAAAILQAFLAGDRPRLDAAAADAEARLKAGHLGGVID